MNMNNKYDIADDEIRILGRPSMNALSAPSATSKPSSDTDAGQVNERRSPLPSATEYDDSLKRRPPKLKWIILIISIFIIALIAAFVFGLFSGEKVEKDQNSLRENCALMQSQQSLDDIGISNKTYAVETTDTINDIPLKIITPLGGKIELYVGKLPRNDKHIVLAAMAADIRADQEIPTGAFVYNGELISKGHAKYGFCAIINGKVTIGRKTETPLFERAIEKNGCFFRQYSLVSAGKMMEVPPKGKSIRRALCMRGKQLFIIETTDRESYHDFAEALKDFYVTEAIALVGGEGLMQWQTEDGKFKLEGTNFAEQMKNENFIIWRVK